MEHASIGRMTVLFESIDRERLRHGSGFATNGYGIKNCLIIPTTKKHRFGNAKCGKIYSADLPWCRNRHFHRYGGGCIAWKRM